MTVTRPPLDPTLADLVQDATARYLQDLDSLTETGQAAPSVLPGWTRGHVVAHVARHGVATAEALHVVLQGRDAVLYPSPEQRAADIDALAGAPLHELRRATLEAAGLCHEAIQAVLHRGDEALAERRVHVFPGSERSMDVTETILTRWREVEIHHADLAGGYGPADWPAAFTDHVLEVVVADRGHECDLVLVTPDRDVVVGSAGGLRVEGTAAGLAWWLLGRPAVPELTGRLPQLSPWQRRS